MPDFYLEIYFLDYDDIIQENGHCSSSFAFLNKEMKVEKNYYRLKIEKQDFKGKEDYIIISFKIKPNEGEEYVANYTLYYGNNLLHCNIKKNYHNNSYEFLFMNINEKVSSIAIGNKEIIHGDNFDDAKKMKRFSLINPSHNEVNILNQNISLTEFTKGLKGNSFQMSFFQ